MNKVIFIILIILLLGAALLWFNLTTCKTVRVSDGSVTFSFTVPRNWAVETRHAGEYKPNLEEMRAFLLTGNRREGALEISPYSDQPSSIIKKLTRAEIEKLYYRSYPNASVADDKQIAYTDSAQQQIDFYILHNFHSLKWNYFNQTLAGNKPSSTSKSTETLAGRQAEVISFPIGKDENDRELITKAGPGGKIYYLPLNTDDRLIIHKQAKGSKSFENNFLELLRSLKFHNM